MVNDSAPSRFTPGLVALASISGLLLAACSGGQDADNSGRADVGATSGVSVEVDRASPRATTLGEWWQHNTVNLNVNNVSGASLAVLNSDHSGDSTSWSPPAPVSIDYGQRWIGGVRNNDGAWGQLIMRIGDKGDPFQDHAEFRCKQEVGSFDDGDQWLGNYVCDHVQYSGYYVALKATADIGAASTHWEGKWSLLHVYDTGEIRTTSQEDMPYGTNETTHFKDADHGGLEMDVWSKGVTPTPTVSPTPPPVSLTQTWPDSVKVGEQRTATISVTNNTEATIGSLSLTDSFPVELGVTAVSGPNCSGEATAACTISDLAEGKTATITVTFTPSTAATVTNEVATNGIAHPPTDSAKINISAG